MTTQGACPHCGVAVDIRQESCSQCGGSLLMDLFVDVHDDESRETAAQVLADACGGDKPRFARSLAVDSPVPLRAAPMIEAQRAHEALGKRGITSRCVPMVASLRPSIAEPPAVEKLAKVSRGKAVGITLAVIAVLFLVRFTLFGDDPPPPVAANAAPEPPKLSAEEKAAAAAREAHQAEMDTLKGALAEGGLLTAASVRTTVEEVAEPAKKKKRRKRKKRKPKTRKVRTLRAQVMMTGNDASTRSLTFHLGDCQWTQAPALTVPLDADAWQGKTTPLADVGRIVPVQQGVYELPLSGCDAATKGAQLSVDGAPEAYSRVALR